MAMDFSVSRINRAISEDGLDDVCTMVELEMSKSKTVTVPKYEVTPAQEEIADIFIYLLRLSDKLDVDIEDAVNEKLEINASKYPVELAKDNAVKYSKR